MNSKKVNDVGAQGKDPRLYDFDIKEKEKYLDWEKEGFLAMGQGSTQDFWNMSRGNEGSNYCGDKYGDRRREIDGDWKQKDDYKKRVVLMFCKGIKIIILEWK